MTRKKEEGGEKEDKTVVSSVEMAVSVRLDWLCSSEHQNPADFIS